MPATMSSCSEGVGSNSPGSGAADRGEVLTTRSVPAHESFEFWRPYRIGYPERFRMKIFTVPRHLLGRSEGDLRQLTARAMQPTKGLVGLLSPVMSRLADISSSFDTWTAERLAQSFVGRPSHGLPVRPVVAVPRRGVR